jgi:ABC-type branched-subunit amino acid transport system substrate-binding protein
MGEHTGFILAAWACCLLFTVRSLEADSTAAPLRIGLLLPPEEAEAASLRQGVQLGVDHANTEPGAQAELLIRGRTGQWGADGEEAGRMVIDDGVRGLIAPPGGAPSHLALQVSGRTATPVISLCADLSVTGAGIPWMVRVVPSNLDEAVLIYSAIKTRKSGGVLQWGALVPDERAGREAGADLRKAADKAGSQLSLPVKISPSAAALETAQKAVLAAKPDGILLWLEPALAGQLAKALRAAGFNGTLAGPSRLHCAGFTRAAGNAAEGFILPSPVLDMASQRVFDRFAADYRQRFGAEPDLTASMAYDAGMLLIEVLRSTGDQPPYRAFPLRRERPGASGLLKFDAVGNRILSLQLMECRNGRYRPLAKPDKSL